MNSATHYDVVIIGAGMSGLAAGIRLAHFGKKVCIFERHNAPGGLNGFYSIAGRKYDVGLHAMTNYVPPGVKGTPLVKLLRQLRIDREQLDLCEQGHSRIAFGPAGEVSLRFTNQIGVLQEEIARQFPGQRDGFVRLVEYVKTYDDVSLTAQARPARETVRQFITDPLLEDMLFCPVMYYGSPNEHDMEFGQFVIMFKALYLEGFARPFEGVRVIIRALLEKYREGGGERRMKCGVKRILSSGGKASGVELDTGEVVTATHVLSSIGLPETRALIRETVPASSQILDTQARAGGRTLSYVETITVLDRPPVELGLGDDTIVFFNDSERFSYERPQAPVDLRSGVICIPNNFNFGAERRLDEGWFRCTCLANHAAWAGLGAEAYAAAKAEWYSKIQDSVRRFLPAARSAGEIRAAVKATDMFTPKTIVRFTGHHEGAIYGSTEKVRQGNTELENVYLCGTDQGFLGIVGAMLSGISMANYHILQKG